MEITHAILLVADAVALDVERLRAAVARRVKRAIDVQVVTGEAEAVVSAARGRHGGVPLGYIGLGEAEEIAALRGGADEAIAAPPAGQPLEPVLNRFVDRLFARAEVRHQAEQLGGTNAHAEKLAALGTVVAGVGHEINNPLTALSLTVESARRVVQPVLGISWELRRLLEAGQPVPVETLQELVGRLGPAGRSDPTQLLDEMASASRSIADVVRDLRVFARVDDNEDARVLQLQDVVEHVLRMVGPELTRHAVLERDYERKLPDLVLPRNRLAQVAMNILVNAGHAVREVQRPMHSIRITTRMDDEFVALCISDTGPGIPHESLERIFDPFYTTKRETLGTGLGLSISRSILRGFGGDLIVESIFGEGATFICLLPQASEQVLAEARRRALPDRPRHDSTLSRSVLVVDEDERVLRACARYLSRTCSVVIARDGREAVDLLVSGSQVDAVLTELELPELDGLQFHAWLRRHHPQLAARTVVMGSALSLSGARRSELHDAGIELLEKPLDAERLVDAIARVLQDPVALDVG